MPGPEKIDSLKTVRKQLELEFPLETSLGTIDKVESVLVRIETDQGTVGWGEAAPADDVTGETPATVEAACERAKELVEGESLNAYRRINRKLESRIEGQRSAIAGIETAVFDAMCRSLEIGIADAVGGAGEDVTTDYTITMGDEDETRENVEKAVDAGFDQLKVKIGSDLEKDIEKIELISRLAPDVELKVDANQGYTVKEALRFAREMERRDIELALFEQPVKASDFEGLERVTASVSVPVAADESLFTREDAVGLVSMDAADVYNIKLAKSGVVQALDIVSIVEAANRELMIGCMAESNVGIKTAAHLVSGTGSFSYVDLDAPFFLEDELAETGFGPEVEVEGPGHGVEVDI